MYTVFVQGLEFYAYHGVSAEEQKIGHRYLAEVRIEVDGRADANDEIKNTVDYVSVAESVIEISGAQRFRTLEKLASTIAEEVLKRHKLVQNVWISLAKPLPPGAIIAETVGVELGRSRD